MWYNVRHHSNTTRKDSIFMNIIASDASFRQRVVKRSYKIGVTQASNYYKVSRNAIYEWRKKYDGTRQSLEDRSHRPHHHPREHTAEEKEAILKRYPYYKHDLIRLWDSLRKDGYSRHYCSMLRVIRKWVEPELRKRRRKNKPYKRADFPGEKVQVDVKYVPSECISDGNKYYQYTAVDECTRWTFRYMYAEHSTASSADFLDRFLEAFPAPVREIQTDNGTEFTKAFLTNNPNNLTIFEKKLKKYGIKYHRIRVATPRHNGKVERQHREDQKRFYDRMRMYCLADGQKQLDRYTRQSNKIPKTCLRFKCPETVLYDYLSIM